MKLDELLRLYPWKRTFAELCADPPPAEDLPLRNAERLIAQQRDSQLETLLNLMVSPVLEPTYAHDAPPGTARETPVGAFQLGDRRRTARLFLDTAIRAGDDLRPFEPAALDKLSGDNAVLGRFLRLLATASETDRAERASHSNEWRTVMSHRADLGLVLSPMIYSGGNPKPESTDPLIERLTGAIAKQFKDPPTDRNLKSPETLSRWTTGLAREGYARLEELRDPLGIRLKTSR